MTAAHERRAALEVVPDPDDTVAGAPTADGDDWRAQTVIDQYSPEHQFVGSLMWLTAEQARPLLDLVPDAAIWRPQTRWAYELIRSVVDAGEPPTPVVVLRLAASQPPADERPDLPPPFGPPADRANSYRARRGRDLALYLFEAYSQAVAPAAAVDAYARAVLDEAYRRAFDTCGIRMQQLASCGADRDDLTTQFAVIRDELADLWRRAEAAAKPEGSQP